MSFSIGLFTNNESGLIEDKEILERVNDVVSILKSFKPDEKNPYPNYYYGYAEACKDYDAILPHATKGVFPEKLFKERAPNETQVEQNHAKNNFKQVTMPVFLDFVNSIKRSFNDGNWSIQYGKEKFTDEDMQFRSYVEKGIKPFGSVENWVKLVLPTIKSQDACGVVAVRPHEMKYKITEDNGEQVISFDDSELVEPVPFYFNIKQIVGYKDSEWFLIESMDKSKVTHNNATVKEGLIYEFYDKDAIYFIEQYGKKTDWTFQVRLFFEHKSGTVPVHRLMGIPIVKENKIFFQAPFLYAVDNLDLVLLNSSRLQLCTDKSVYPVRVMVGNECQFTDQTTGSKCFDGSITFEGKTKSCPNCYGTGLKTRITPMGDLLLRPKSSTQDADITPDQALKYVQPEVTTLDFLMKKISDDESRARKILHLSTSSSEVKGDPTATGMAIDQKALYSFIKPISDEMFFLYEFILNCIRLQRYGQDVEAPTLTYPASFEFFTADDYLAQIKQATEAGLPPFVINAIVYKFLSSLYYTEKETARVFELILRSDRLLSSSGDEIAMMISRQTAAKWEEILHESGVSIVMELEREDQKFWDKSIDEQITAVQVKAQEIANSVAVTPNTITEPLI